MVPLFVKCIGFPYEFLPQSNFVLLYTVISSGILNCQTLSRLFSMFCPDNSNYTNNVVNFLNTLLNLP